MASKPDRVELDIRGQICPSALLIALREINTRKHDLRDGATQLVVLTDDRNATATIPEAAENMGYQTSVEKIAGHYVIAIRIAEH